jgi:hypothetical protein
MQSNSAVPRTRRTRIVFIVPVLAALGFVELQLLRASRDGSLYSSSITTADVPIIALSAVKSSAIPLVSTAEEEYGKVTPNTILLQNNSKRSEPLKSSGIDDASSTAGHTESDIISATETAKTSSMVQSKLSTTISNRATEVNFDGSTNILAKNRGHVVLNQCLIQANDKYIKAVSANWDHQGLPQFGSIVQAPHRYAKNTLVWYATFSIKRIKYATPTPLRKAVLATKWMVNADWHCDGEKGKLVGEPSSRQDMITIACPNERVSNIRVYNTTYHVGAHVHCALESPLPLPVGKITGGLYLFGIAAKNVSECIPWMEYHRMLGVDHFYVYLMASYSKEEEKMLPNLPYITYVPFLVMHPSQIPRNLDGGSRIFGFQLPQMQDLLYRARAAGFEWLFYNDVDEYIQVMQGSLQQYLSESVAYLELQTWCFGNAAKGHRDRMLSPPELTIDYIFRAPEPVSKGRQKCLVRPDQIDLYDVHQVKSGGPGRLVHPKKEMRLNHYKNAHARVNGLERNESAVKDTSFREQFREILKAGVKES